MVHADDCNFITELEQKKERIYQKAKTILTNKNVLVKIQPSKERKEKQKKNGETSSS